MMADGMRVSGGMYAPPVELQPHQLCAVSLRADQWQEILRMLHQAPYGVAAPLIQAIMQQCLQPQPQLQPTPQAE